MNRVVVLLAVLFGVSAFFVPLEVLEVLGAPVIVAGAYVGGRRGGVLTSLWATLVATIAFLVLQDAVVEYYVVTVLCYLAIGLLVGTGLERYAERDRRLEEALQEALRAKWLLTASERRSRMLFNGSSDAVYVHGLDAAGEPSRFVAVNNGACELFGYTREEMLGLTPRAVDGSPQPGQLRKMMTRLILEDRVLYETMCKTRGGELVPIEISSTTTEVDGHLMVMSIARDVTERKKTERRLEELSLRDDLTGLLNRRGLTFMLPEQVKRARRSGNPVVVLYCDLDNFKAFNDTYGHRRGDDVLVAVSGALKRTFRETDLLARQGGDEFCVIAEAEEGTEPDILADRLDAAMDEVREELGLEVVLSHGAVVTDWRGIEDADKVLELADARMYATKRARSGAVRR